MANDKIPLKRWSLTIRPVSGWFDVNLRDIWRYRDLIFLFVRRDFISIYKQTVLGPAWYVVQPIMTVAVLIVVFNKIARISTDGLPPLLFYLSGIVTWKYFSDCLLKTANTFTGNAGIFGKVYFPRLTVPLSVVVSGLISFSIQFGLFILLLLYYLSIGADIHIKVQALLLPILVLQMAALGLGCGIIISSLTTKYRDLAQLVGFGVQLWMYATPVVYPASIVPVQWQWVMFINPMTSVVETFRFMFMGVGTFNATGLIVSMITTVVLLFLGVILFSRIERSFMDTV